MAKKTDHANYWGDLGLDQKPDSDFDPLHELQEQADALETQTKGAVIAEIRTIEVLEPLLMRPEYGTLEDLDDILEGGRRSPLHVAKEINEALSDLEGAAVMIYHHTFDLYVPKVDYRFRLFAIEHLVHPPPVVFDSPPIKFFGVARRKSDFWKYLELLLSHSKTRLLVKTLVDRGR